MTDWQAREFMSLMKEIKKILKEIRDEMRNSKEHGK